MVFMVRFLDSPGPSGTGLRPNSKPRGSRSVCSLRRRSEVDRTLSSPSRRSSSGSVSAVKRFTSAPTESTVLPALALVRATSLPIFSTASALRPMRSITGPSLRRRACSVFSKVRAALAMPASSVSLRAAIVCATAAMSASALLNAARFSSLRMALMLFEVLSSFASTVVSTFSRRALSEGLVRITGYSLPAVARSGGASRAPPLSST